MNIAPWLVLGPRSEGRDYGILARWSDADLSHEAEQLLEDYALMTLAAAPIGRRYFSFFPIETGSHARWALAATDEHEGASRGAVRLTWVLLLDESQIEQLGSGFAALRNVFPPERALVPASPLAPLDWPPNLSPPEEAVVWRASVLGLARKHRTAFMVHRDAEGAAFGVINSIRGARSRTFSFATRADLSARGGFSQMEPTWLLCFSENDPPVNETKFNGYSLVRRFQSGHVEPRVEAAAGLILWDELNEKLEKTDFRKNGPEFRKMLAAAQIADVHAPGSVIEAHISHLISEFAAPKDMAKKLIECLAIGAKMLKPEDRPFATSAIKRAFVESMPQNARPASVLLSFYAEKLLPWLGEEQENFVIETALANDAFLLLSERALEHLMPIALRNPSRLEAAFKPKRVEPEALCIMMKGVAAGIHSTATRKDLAQLAGLLLWRWTILPDFDVKLDEASFTLMRALAAAQERDLMHDFFKNLATQPRLPLLNRAGFLDVLAELMDDGIHILKSGACTDEVLASSLSLGLSILCLSNRYTLN